MNELMTTVGALLVGTTLSAAPDKINKEFDWVERTATIRCLPTKEYFDFLVSIDQRPIVTGETRSVIYMITRSEKYETMAISVIFKDADQANVCQIAGIVNPEIHQDLFKPKR